VEDIIKILTENNDSIKAENFTEKSIDKNKKNKSLITEFLTPEVDSFDDRAFIENLINNE